MKNQMKLVITDDPVSDVKMALAKEHHDRTMKLGELVAAGHVTVMEDCDAVRVRVKIEDEVFSEDRERFPTTELMARLQLAIHAGLSERNRVKIMGDNHASDAMAYAALGKSWKSYHQQLSRMPRGADPAFMSGDRLWYDEAAKIPAKITATVKKALRKGLRP